MPLIFPNNPTLGQTYQSGSSGTFVYNGEAWDSQNSNLPITVTSASFATTASFAQTRPTPRYISAVKGTQQDNLSLGTDVTFQNVVASNGLSLTGGTSVTLPSGSAWEINASFSAFVFSDASSGFLVFNIVDSANTILANSASVALIPVALSGSVGMAFNTPTVNTIISPSVNTTVKFRCTQSSGTASVRQNLTHFTIKEII
jgi:hypothetical protein